MREHKYRGRRIGNGEWVHGWLYSIVPYGNSHERGYMIKEDMGDDYEVDPETVGQYTGLHDDTEEDQNELFEDDIVEAEYEGQKHICLIKYEAGGFLFVSDSFPDSYLYLSELAEYDRTYGWVEGAKKLGNIHEHPHLLGGNQT